MDYKNYVTASPDIMLGKPIIKGTRITVELILKKLSEGMTADDLIKIYPHIQKDDIMACLSYSAEVISREEIIAS